MREKRHEVILCWRPPQGADEQLEKIYSLMGKPADSSAIRMQLLSEAERLELEAKQLQIPFRSVRVSPAAILLAFQKSYDTTEEALDGVLYNFYRQYGEQHVGMLNDL